MTNTQWLKRRLYSVLIGKVGDKTETLESLRETEWSPEFEKLMRVRLIQGRFRYGLFQDEDKEQYDRITSAMKRLRLFQKTGNKEHLIDIANLMLVEFKHTIHPLAHFEATDDGPHCEVLNNVL